MYENETGDEPRQQDTQANKGSPLLSEEVPYQITLIGLGLSFELWMLHLTLTPPAPKQVQEVVFSGVPRSINLDRFLCSYA